LAIVSLSLAACAGESVSTSAVSATSSSLPAATTNIPPTTAGESGLSTGVWHRLSDDVVLGGAGYQEMRSVVVGGPGFVAVGYDEAGGDRDAAVWTSSDGLAWTRVPHDEAVFGGIWDQEAGRNWDQVMHSVVVGGPGLVAVGIDAYDAAVWTSPDGLAWTRVPHDETVFGGSGRQSMVSAVAGGPGLVAVGNDYSEDDWENDAAVWTSPDGLTWARVPHDEEVFGAGQRMSSVVVGGLGLVAVGSGGPGAHWAAAVWTSPDGLSWTRVPRDEEVFGGSRNQWMSSVVAGGPGLVAVGVDTSGDDTDAAVWTSPDGLTWARVSHDEEVFGAGQRMSSVVVGGPGLVAVGVDHNDAAVWTSPDALTWTRVPHDEEIFGGGWDEEILSVVAGDERLVAVGVDHNDAAVWTSPDGITWTQVPREETTFSHAEMSSVVVGGPGLVAVGSGEQGAAVWTSPDGISWTRLPHDEAVFGDARMYSVVMGGPGLVAVGNDYSDAAVWTSPDGIIWTRVPHDEAALGGPGYQAMFSVAVGGPGLVAVGFRGSGPFESAAACVRDAAVWTSPDGITWTQVPHDETVFGGSCDESMGFVTAGGPGLVAAGSGLWTSPDGITWTQVRHDDAIFGGAPSSVVVGGPGLVAVGSDYLGGDRDAAVWISSDEINWDQVPHDETVFGGDRYQGMWSVTAASWGLVAVGGDNSHSKHDDRGVFHPDQDAAVWTSPDGLSWTRVPNHEEVFGGPGDQHMSSVVAGGPGIVAVGADSGEAAVWYWTPDEQP
jgi:hypothetical protein